MQDAIVSIDSAVSLQEMAQGLDWVRWLLSRVRQRSGGILLACQSSAVTVQLQWGNFADRWPSLAVHLLQAWHAAQSRDLDALLSCDAAWAAGLGTDAGGRSAVAGELLLERTEGARYQGVLGMLRQAVAEGGCVGHIGSVWPAVAVLFQLTPSMMLSEYLRLEWETMTRDLRALPEPQGALGFQALVQQALRGLHTEASFGQRGDASTALGS
jgi:hypothetical protein